MESKIHATERLRRDGRWDQASAFRDETRRKLRAEGKSKIEAGELAWEAMIAKFPPPEHPQLGSEDEPLPREKDDAEEDLDALDERFAESPPDLVRDTLWVYENLGRKLAAAADAPGRGAWELLNWARQHQDRFFQHMLPKAMGAKAKQDEKVRARRVPCPYPTFQTSQDPLREMGIVDQAAHEVRAEAAPGVDEFFWGEGSGL